MKLKPTLLAASLALATGALALAPAAFAADGTITINGQVVSATCNISFNGGTAAAAPVNGTVTLPPVSTTTLGAPGDTGGAMPFSVGISGCTDEAGKTMVAVFSGNNINTTDGNLTTATGGASNVEVQLANAASPTTGLKLNLGEGNQGVTGATVDSSGNATASFIAQYYATGAATAGTVTTNVDYTLVYE
ncbi:MAG TPA: type 1 fimbrial protein [Rhodanobacteraceae bacterium]